jgi:hypothetical protein
LRKTVANWLRSEFAWSCLLGALVLSAPLSAQSQTPATVLVDRDMTPAAGAADVLALRRLLASFEDRLLPARFSEATPSGNALGILYRVGKWAAIDLPQDSFLMVVAHEMFGHGARLREIGASGVRYQFDAPPPYGDGGAATLVDGMWPHTAARADLLAIDAAGIETQNLLADDISERALARGWLSYRDAWLYAESRLAGLLYIRSVSPQSEPGHDVAQFLNHLNDGCMPPACTPLEPQTLKRHALLMLVDPMLAFSAYEFAAAYLVRGRAAMAVPVIPLGHGFGYLPAVGFAMTPYGTELTTDHYIRSTDRLTRLSVRIGDTGALRTWGIGVQAAHVAQWDRIAVDLSADMWRQPALDALPSATGLKTGGLLAATMHAALGRRQTSRPWALVAELGYKSDGFARGEWLRAGPIMRVGLAIPINVDR